MAAVNELFLERVRLALHTRNDVEEKKMFGGITFMVDDKMCIGVKENELLFRIDPELHETLIESEGSRPMNKKDGTMYYGYIYVSTDVLESNAKFDYWVNLALEQNLRVKPSKKVKK